VPLRHSARPPPPSADGSAAARGREPAGAGLRDRDRRPSGREAAGNPAERPPRARGRGRRSPWERPV